jgi:ubiquinone/menaquinone biosynthesis C-methylase UbiE
MKTGWLKSPACSGTGAPTHAELEIGSPCEVVGMDRSAAYFADAGSRVSDLHASFKVEGTGAIFFPARTFDGVVLGPGLNFVPDPGAAE